MKPNDSTLHRPHSYCSSKTCLVWCKSGELGRSQVTSFFLFAICFPEILYGGDTIKSLYTLNWLAVMSSWYHSCAVGWCINTEPEELQLTRISAGSKSLAIWPLFFSFSPHSCVALFFALMISFFMGCCAPQSLHILMHILKMCTFFIVDPGILLKRKTNNISLYH